MKRTITIAVCLVFVSAIDADDYRPMLKDGRIWNSYWTNGYYEGRQEMSINGDSIIDGEKWFKLYYSLREWKTDTIVTQRGLMGFLREQDRQVFYLNRYGFQQLLYDFNLKTGDLWYQDSSMGITENIIINGIDSIIFEDITYRRFKIQAILESNSDSPSYDYADGFWLEGIGGSRGLLWTTGWFNPDGKTSLLSCYDGDTCIFSIDGIDNNGVAPINKPIQPVTTSTNDIFNLQGWRMGSQYLHGIYIKNNKKYIK